MTGAEWRACEDPEPMLAAVRDKASERKLRLFACACCRRVWHLLIHPVSRKAVEVAEKYADGRATANRLYDVYQAADDIAENLPHVFDGGVEDESLARTITKTGAHHYARVEAAVAPVFAAEHFGGKGTFPESHTKAAEAIGIEVGGDGGDERAEAGERAVQASLLRDIFGDAYRPVAFSPT